MRATLLIETSDKSLGSDFSPVGITLLVPGGGTLEYQGTLIRKSIGAPEILKFVIEASTDIDFDLFAAWLHNQLKQRPVTKIILNRRVAAEITKDGIRQCLEDELHAGEC